MTNWPDDADGDVMWRLEADGFDFDRVVNIDFNVDFDIWPLSAEVITLFEETRPDARITIHDEDRYVRLQIAHLLTYDFVIAMQEELTRIAKPFGGGCDSWGVLHD